MYIFFFALYFSRTLLRWIMSLNIKINEKILKNNNRSSRWSKSRIRDTNLHDQSINPFRDALLTFQCNDTYQCCDELTVFHNWKIYLRIFIHNFRDYFYVAIFELMYFYSYCSLKPSMLKQQIKKNHILLFITRVSLKLQFHQSLSRTFIAVLHIHPLWFVVRFIFAIIHIEVSDYSNRVLYSRQRNLSSKNLYI